jgi:hypothetical protein
VGAQRGQGSRGGGLAGEGLLTEGEALFAHAARVLQEVNPAHWALPQIAEHFGGRLPL